MELEEVSLVGDTLRNPLRAAGGAARDLASAGQGLEDRATWLAIVLALAVAVPPILGVVVPWAALRLTSLSGPRTLPPEPSMNTCCALS